MEKTDMDSDAFLDQEYENLNDAILQAIVLHRKKCRIFLRDLRS